MRSEPGQAAVVDAKLLGDIADACAWWKTQPTWHVSSSHTGGGVIAAFEQAITLAVGSDARALALPSATQALSTALRALNLQPGDAIGVPALDWTATTAVASSLGLRTTALPVTSDAGLLDTRLLAGCPTRLEGLSAVVAVHLHGLSCDTPVLRRAQQSLPIIEDAAQAWGACYPDGSPVGSAADACVFSFGATKLPAAGELGCLVTRTIELHQRAIALTQHPTRQLLTGIGSPGRDAVMARVAPAVALLGAHALARHTQAVPCLRHRARRLGQALGALGLEVLSDASIHAPGVVVVRADVAEVHHLLPHLGQPIQALVAEVDAADISPHCDLTDRRSLALLASSLSVLRVKAPW